MTSKPKDAFEKIRSRLQKRDIYKEAITEAKPFTIKLDEDLHSLVPTAVDDKQLSFIVTGPPLPDGKKDGIGFFQVGTDRYFFNGALNNSLRLLIVSLDVDVFKLQRRKTMRADVPDDFPIHFLITQIGEKPAFVDASVVDISGGGVRVIFPKGGDQDIAVGTFIKASVRDPADRVIPFEGHVRHIMAPDPKLPAQKFYGIELSLQNGLSQRLMMLTMEVQRRVVRGY